MKKLARVLALVLIFMNVFGFLALAVDDDAVGRSIYSDWDAIGTKYKNSVLSLSIHPDGLNVFQGSGGRFDPKASFTRAEVLSLVAVVTVGGNPDKLELNTLFSTDAAREPRFSDVPRTHWAYGAINYAARMGFIEGTGGNIFSPSTLVTVDMVNSMLLSLLGVKAEDKNGADWVAKTAMFMKTHNIRLDADVANYNPTREEVASALNVAVNTSIFQRKADGSYERQESTLLQEAFGSPEDKQAFTLTGKVIGTKYASLNGVNNYSKNVLLECVGVNDGKANGTVFRLETPESDGVVPVALLGRVVTLKTVKISEGLYRAAKGAKAVPAYTTDVVSLPVYKDGTLNEVLYNSASADIPTENNYSGIRGNSVQFRGAYTNYGAGDGYDPDWNPVGNWTYAYAVIFGNTNYYSEVFYLNYRALIVSDLYNDGTMNFKALDGVTSVSVNSAKSTSFENGTALAKGDIIVAVVDSENNIVTAEKVTSSIGIKQGNLSNGGVVIGGISYNIWDNYVNYANRNMPGSWGSGVQSWIQNANPITYWAFRPVYGEYTGAAARIFHSSAPNEYKDKWFEWGEQPAQIVMEDYCIVTNAAPGTDGFNPSVTNAAVTIITANGKDSGTYKLNNLYVREVKPMSWLGDIRMHSTLADRPIQGFGLNNNNPNDGISANKGITTASPATADGLFLADIDSDILYLRGICIYSYKLSANGYIDLTELDAGLDSGMEILKVHKDQSVVQAGNALVVNKDDVNVLLYSQGKALSGSVAWQTGVPVSDSYSLNTSNAIWFTIDSAGKWHTGYPGKAPKNYILVFTVGKNVQFIIYKEE